MYLQEETAGTAEKTPVERLRGAVWEMLYADDAGVVSRSAEGLARMTTTVVIEIFAKFGLTLPEKETETFLMRLPVKRPKKGEPPPSPRRRRISRQRDSGTPSRLSFGTWAGS